jgi:hypothetical protein
MSLRNRIERERLERLEATAKGRAPKVVMPEQPAQQHDYSRMHAEDAAIQPLRNSGGNVRARVGQPRPAARDPNTVTITLTAADIRFQRECKVSVADIEGVEHSTQVTAGSLYEAVAAALASIRKDEWVGEIGTGLTTVKVEVLQPGRDARSQNERFSDLASTKKWFTRRYDAKRQMRKDAEQLSEFEVTSGRNDRLVLGGKARRLLAHRPWENNRWNGWQILSSIKWNALERVRANGPQGCAKAASRNARGNFPIFW